MKKKLPPIMPILMRLRCCCEKNQREVCNDIGISSAEFSCLTLLNETEQASGAEIADRLRLSASRGSRVIDKMVESGLLHRKPDLNDRRVIRVSLTDHGKIIKNKLTEQMRECEKIILNKLSDNQLDIVIEGLDILLGAIDD